VLEQAWSILSPAPRGRLVQIRLSRRGLALPAISLILAFGAVLLVAPDPSEGTAHRLASSVEKMSTAQRMEVVRSLLRRADQGPQSQDLRQAARALRRNDSEQFRSLLEQLARDGVDLQALLSDAMPDAGAGGSGAGGDATGDEDRRPTFGPERIDPGRQEVFVYRPAGGADAESSSLANPTETTGRIGYTSPRDAWRDARKRATDALLTEAVPMRHRDWVREYFSPAR
jgi:hypothetical protein